MLREERDEKGSRNNKRETKVWGYLLNSPVSVCLPQPIQGKINQTF